MSPQSIIILAALALAGMYSYRYLVGGQTARTVSVGKLIGIGTPVSPEGFVVAWGATFLGLSVLATFAPPLASALALLVLLGGLAANFEGVSKSTQALIRSKTKEN